MKKTLVLCIACISLFLGACSKDTAAPAAESTTKNQLSAVIPKSDPDNYSNRLTEPPPPPPTPEEYTAMGFKTAYNIIVAGTVPSAQNQYYQSTLSLAIANGLTDYQTGLMAGASAGNTKLLGAWQAPLALISDNMLVGSDVLQYTIKFTFSDDTYLIKTFNR